MSEHRVLVTVPQPMRDLILMPETRAKLEALAEVTVNDTGENWTGEEIAARLGGVDALLASWGLPKLSEDVLAGADKLKIVAYAAGSVKGWATDALFERDIAISHAAPRIADSVAEFSLLMAMIGLKQPHLLDRQMKAGEAWPPARHLPIYEIAGKRVGLLGMGYVGRRSARLFQGVGAEVWAYDPYLTEETAAELGVHKAGLDQLMSACQVISVHLPVTEETHHLLGAHELALLPDGAVLVNTARAWTINQDALLAELSSGRIWAALDVFDPEPLPVDHALRQLDNVFLTPHVAGLSRDSYHGLTEEMVGEIERAFAGEPLRYRVTQDMLPTMA